MRLTSQPSVFKRAQANGMWPKTWGLPKAMIGRRLSQEEGDGAVTNIPLRALATSARPLKGRVLSLLASAAIAAPRVAAYPCFGMLCLSDSAGQVFRLRPWGGQCDSSVKEGGSEYESNIVPYPAIRKAIDSDVQKEASKQGKL